MRDFDERVSFVKSGGIRGIPSCTYSLYHSEKGSYFIREEDNGLISRAKKSEIDITELKDFIWSSHCFWLVPEFDENTNKITFFTTVKDNYYRNCLSEKDENGNIIRIYGEPGVNSHSEYEDEKRILFKNTVHSEERVPCIIESRNQDYRNCLYGIIRHLKDKNPYLFESYSKHIPKYERFCYDDEFYEYYLIEASEDDINDIREAKEEMYPDEKELYLEVTSKELYVCGAISEDTDFEATISGCNDKFFADGFFGLTDTEVHTILNDYTDKIISLFENGYIDIDIICFIDDCLIDAIEDREENIEVKIEYLKMSSKFIKIKDRYYLILNDTIVFEAIPDSNGYFKFFQNEKNNYRLQYKPLNLSKVEKFL